MVQNQRTKEKQKWQQEDKPKNNTCSFSYKSVESTGLFGEVGQFCNHHFHINFLNNSHLQNLHMN